MTETATDTVLDSRQRVVVKLGGTLLDEDESRVRLSQELAAVSREYALVVVHGGGKQMTRFLAERGVESHFIDGLRVSTPEVMDAVLKVLAGSVNAQLVASLVQAGAQAVGLSGIDAALVEAVPLRAELGAVGSPTHCNAGLLHLLTRHGYLPTVACVAGDRQGRAYNVNADQHAVACAIGFQASHLLFLTDVDGVRGAERTIFPQLNPAEIHQLIGNGIATGGMQAKLTAACRAVAEGVGRVVVAPGQLPQVAARLLQGDAVGTVIAAETGDKAR